VKNINTDSGELSLLMCGASLFFSHLLLNRQRVEYLCSFLEAVSRLVIHHSLQPVFRYLLRLVVVVVGGGGGGVVVDPLLPPLQNRFQNR